jgi:sugar lactone lactonase YvrE
MINPEEITGDEEGNIYFTDRGNHIYTLRKTGRTGEISTISLTEPNAPSGQTALLLPLSSGGLSSDMAGNLYFSSYQTIFRLSRDNTFSSLAGHPTVGRTNSISINPVDGPGSEAIFYRISKLALDKSGNVYIADGNHIRKLDTQNNVTTLPQLSDSGNVIEFGNDIRGLAVDAVGNIYVSDTSNHVIYKMTASGISIVGGSPRESGSDNGNGSVARFKSPQGIAIDGAGNLYVADTGNHTIRKITPDGTVHTIVGKAGVATVAPGPLPALLSAPTDVTITPDGRLVITAPQGLLQVSPIP